MYQQLDSPAVSLPAGQRLWHAGVF